MASAIFIHRLDLALRLMDTTTGNDVAGHEVMLFYDGKPLHPMEKEKGTLIFPGLGRNDFTLSVTSQKYDSVTIPIRFAELDKEFPIVEIHLIPSKNSISTVPCLSLVGNMSGISDLTAVRMGDTSCLIRDFDPRKKLATIFNPHHLELNRTHYALVDPNEQCYERFSIVKKLDDHTIKLDRVLVTKFGNYFPITPIIFGHTSEDGSYRLRVRDDASAAKWLIHYQIDQESHFQCVDLRQDHEIPQTTKLENTISEE